MTIETNYTQQWKNLDLTDPLVIESVLDKVSTLGYQGPYAGISNPSSSGWIPPDKQTSRNAVLKPDTTSIWKPSKINDLVKSFSNMQSYSINSSRI